MQIGSRTMTGGKFSFLLKSLEPWKPSNEALNDLGKGPKMSGDKKSKPLSMLRVSSGAV